MKNNSKFTPDPKLKLMDQVRQVLRHFDYSYNTEKIYYGWIIKYIKFFNTQNYPAEMKGKEIEVFLNHLAVDKRVSPATQKQALNSLFFLYQKVLGKKVPDKLNLIESNKAKKLPIVLGHNELALVFLKLKKSHLLMAKLLYGSGLRLMECLRLRVQDINFNTNKIFIRGLKNGKDRFVMLPESLKGDLLLQKEHIRALHKKDLQNGYGSIDLPESMAIKSDTSVKSLAFQYLFSAKKTSKDPRSGKIRRHHVLESGLQKAVKNAGKKAELSKSVTCQVFRNSFAAHLLENGADIKVVQKLMGHANLKMTKVYIKVMEKEPPLIKSPLDILNDTFK
jgi:integron integrase